jgi:hypothetical protein
MRPLAYCINGLLSMLVAFYLTKDLPIVMLLDMILIYLLIYWGTALYSTSNLFDFWRGLLRKDRRYDDRRHH